MAAPNVNGRLHLTGVHQKPPASFVKKNDFFSLLNLYYIFVIPHKSKCRML